MTHSITLSSEQIKQLIEDTIKSVEIAKTLSHLAVEKEERANEDAKIAKGFALFLLEDMKKQELLTLSPQDSCSMRAKGIRAINSQEKSETATSEAKKATQVAGEKVQCIKELFESLRNAYPEGNSTVQLSLLLARTAIADRPYVTVADEPQDNRSLPMTLEESLEYLRNSAKTDNK